MRWIGSISYSFAHFPAREGTLSGAEGPEGSWRRMMEIAI